jgi:hypothetical protein
VATLPPSVRQNDPGAYARAVRIVRAAHVDEIVAEEVAKLKGAPAVQPASPSAARHVESGSIASAPSKRTVTLTRNQLSYVENLADSRGVPFAAALEFAQDNGLLK